MDYSTEKLRARGATAREEWAADEIDRLRAELETMKNGLKDPGTVLVNMMRGHIANPHADTAKRNDELCAENERLRAELAEARRVIDEARGQVPVAWQFMHAGVLDSGEFRTMPPQVSAGLYRALYAAPVPAHPARKEQR